ncbi:LppP/LprE family lipoprotein [Nocardia panacis]|uniref:LppP/LprE family lipoprotein n=1 Tax=Nocardia panacis TaxID=2340916 RepID=A0A3A4KR41_9NOCA|nr:LppP/LprE family lipoprotein [Nocardia panacis]RJO75580.1 LppP/LprE family lipoprotein [Nocardia panacis]
MNKTIGATLTAIGLTLAAAGCQDADIPTPRAGSNATVQNTSVETTLASPDSAQAPSSKSPVSPITSAAKSDDAPATSGHHFCVDANNPVVSYAIQGLGPSVGGEPYGFGTASHENVGSCPDLLWVQAETPHGTGSSPSHILFFNHDGYLGTATTKATAFTQVSGSGSRSVEISYRWTKGNEPNCCPTGAATITFTLGADGRTITHNPEIPTEVTK